jgi:HSP20 family molecular chaperone IbpA
MTKKPNDKDEMMKKYEERIARLEENIKELEGESKKQREEIRVEGIVESVVGQFIPGFGGIIKALEQSSPEFRKKIAETDAEIGHRIDVGWSSKPVIDYHISTRPIRRGTGRAASRGERITMPEAPHREPIVDVLEGTEGLMVIAELPGIAEEDLRINLKGDVLEISAGQLSKKIALPRAAESILEKSFKNGILSLKLS